MEPDWDALPVDVLKVRTFTFTYDPAGNRMSQRDVATGDLITNNYDDANRMETSDDHSGITTYTYDENGNTLTIEDPSNDITTNTWDCENRLVQVEHPDSSVTNYTYNADGLQVTKDDSTAGLTVFVRDGNNVLRELDDTGAVLADFTYDPQTYAKVISQTRDGVASFYHFDGIHNTSELTDASSMVENDYHDDAWGNLVDPTITIPNSQLFKGEFLAYHNDPEAGPESIFSLHHRNYSATTGRFQEKCERPRIIRCVAVLCQL